MPTTSTPADYPFQVTVGDPRWPQLCACCVAPLETTVKLKFEQLSRGGIPVYSRVWDIPYCAQCAAHIETASKYSNLNIDGGWLFGALAALAVGLYLGGLAGSAVPFYITAVIVVIALQYPMWSSRAEAKAEMKPHCAGPGRAVRCVAHRAHEGEDTHTFEFTSGYYMKEFQKLNS